MGRVIVLNEAARAVRSPAVLRARQRHLQVHLRQQSPEVYEAARSQPKERSTGERVEKLICVISLWVMFVAYIVVRTPADLGRSVVRLQCAPDRIAAPVANPEDPGEVRLSRAEPPYSNKR